MRVARPLGRGLLVFSMAAALLVSQPAKELAVLSWEAREALAAGDLDKAEALAAKTRKGCLEALRHRTLDADKDLPTALGAAIEVHARVLTARGRRSEAVAFLEEELASYRRTSIRTRIQKNLHLLTLEGRPAPPLEGLDLAPLKGRAVLLFFWAHWCGDCKAQEPALEKLLRVYGRKGLVLAGPTRLYGYTARGEEASPEQETAYIADVRRRYYAGLGEMRVPVAEENFRAYGASTSPTLVLLDRQGMVRLYHPGVMSYEELAARVRKVLGASG